MGWNELQKTEGVIDEEQVDLLTKLRSKLSGEGLIAPTEDEVEEVESPREEYVEEQVVEEIPSEEETLEAVEMVPINTIDQKSNTIWYVLLGILAVIIILSVLFLIKYEVKITRKE